MSEMMRTEIAREAYFLWIKDGMTHGRAEQHWTAAEKLVAKRKVTTARKKPQRRKLNG